MTCMRDGADSPAGFRMVGGGGGVVSSVMVTGEGSEVAPPAAAVTFRLLAPSTSVTPSVQ